MKIREKDCVCQTPQHTAVLGDEETSRRAPSVQTGPIAVLPENHDDTFTGGSDQFRDAVIESGGTLHELSPETKGLVWLSYKKSSDLAEVLAQNPQLTWVQLPWAGVDAFADILKQYSLPTRVFTSAKGAYAQPVAEHAVAMSLALLRLFPRRIRANSWDAEPKGVSLFGKNVTIIGAGGIAREIIRLLVPFNTRITVVRRSAGSVPGAFRTVTTDRLDNILPDSDVVIVAAASTSETRHLFGPSQFALMKNTAVFVNIARGALVDSSALEQALNSGQIMGAAIDVTEPEPLPDGHPLWTAQNILITPHMADTPEMTGPLLVERIRTNVAAFVTGSTFTGVVDTEAGY